MKRRFRLLCSLTTVIAVFTCCISIWAYAAESSGTIEVRSINHRGYNTDAPENTLPAYELSKEKGFDYVETDISFTKDLVPVLLHDSWINRTARYPDGKELEYEIEIADITYEEALQYDFGIWKDESYAGTKLPTFESFLDLCKDIGLHPYIELKENGEYTQDLINGLVDLTAKKEMSGDVTWISFNPEYLGWVRDMDPNARLGVLTTWVIPDFINASIETAKALKTDSNHVFLDIDIISADSPDGIRMCREAGIPLEVYCFEEDDEDAMKALDPYVSGLTSNQIRFEDIR